MSTSERSCRIIDNEWIVLDDGCRLAARLWLPDGSDERPVPAILEYLPYRKRGGTDPRDDDTYRRFADHGYAGVRVDIRGNGESDALMRDEYTPEELANGVEVIAWIARQPWCDGNVGMFGHSWGGFNGLMIAALRPPALKAIVTSCSTDDRYADDIHFIGGCLNNDNTTWSQQMLAYSSRPPDPAIVGERWRERWLHRLENLPFLAANWLAHQRRDDFWRHGSVCEDYAAIEAAVLAVGGWHDCYTNAIPRLLAGLSAPVKGIIGPWEHRFPHLAKVTPGIDFPAECVRWWDRWLKGRDNGIEDEPALRAFLLDAAPASGSNGPRGGHWVAEPEWPSPTIGSHTLFLTERGLGDDAPGERTIAITSAQHVGLCGGNFCPGMRVEDELPADQQEDDALSVCFDSVPLETPLAVLGAPELELELSADKPLALLVARLCDVAPDGRSTRVSYQALNLTHRESHEGPRPLEPGERFRCGIRLCDAGYVFRPGHRLRLALSTSYWPLVWPAPEPATLTLYLGASRIRLPVRSDLRSDTAFAPVPEPLPVAFETLRKPHGERRVTRDPAGGEVRLELRDDLGRQRSTEHGLVTDVRVRHRYTIRPDDPLSARVEADWTFAYERDDWRIRTETATRMTADRESFHLFESVRAYEGETLVFERDRERVIARDHV